MEQAVATGGNRGQRRRAPHAVMNARIRAVSAVVDLAKTESALDEMDSSIQNPAPSPPLKPTAAAVAAWKKTPEFEKIKAGLRANLERMDATLTPFVRAIVVDTAIESLESDAEGWDDLEDLAALRDKLRILQTKLVEIEDIVEQMRKFDDDLQNESLSTTLRLNKEWAKAGFELVEKCRAKALASLKADIEAQASEVAEVAREWSNTDADGWDGKNAHAG